MGGTEVDPESTVTDADDEAAPGGEVIVYEASDGDVQVDVRFDRETAWLTQRQMAEVFGTTPENVLMHLRNVFSSGELDADPTTKDFLVVRAEGDRTVRRRLKHYNLDAIISVGYRVNSKRGVRFRQWATRTLREHLIHGYTLNERRLAERGLREARESLYRSREEKAAHLLYFIVKDHPFTDGNKRIGSLLFLLYLKQENVEHELNPQAVTALTLLIAESAAAAKDLMVRLIMNLLIEPSESDDLATADARLRDP